MDRKTTYLVAGGVAAGVGAWWLVRQTDLGGPLGDVAQLLNDAINAIVKGSKVTSCPYDKTTGVVPCPPEDLADAAGVDVETYALARMIASEEGRSPNIIKAAVAWSAVNRATRGGRSILSLLTRANVATHAGYFGTQRNIDPSNGGDPRNGPSDRYASTANDPYEGDIMIASQVLSGQIPDFTGGADQYDRPGSERDPDKVAADRIASGSSRRTVEGIDEDADGIRFWGPA